MGRCYLSNEEINALIDTQVGSWTVLSYLNKEYDMTPRWNESAILVSV